MPSSQAGQDVSVRYKDEGSTFGIKPGATGATTFRANPGPGLHYGTRDITDEEIRDDRQSSQDELGSAFVDGSLIGNARYGEHDAFLAAALRGTWATGKLLPGYPAIDRSFTIEEYLVGADETSVYKGCRIGGFTLRVTPRGIVTLEYPVVGADMELLTGAAAPYFTSTTRSTTGPMTPRNAVVMLDGVAQTNFTELTMTVDIGAAGIDAIGSPITPDVWTNNMRVSGSLTMTKKNATALQGRLAGTLFEIAVPLTDRLLNTLTFTVLQLRFTDYTKQLGASGPYLTTLPFSGGKKETGADIGMVMVETAAAA